MVRDPRMVFEQLFGSGGTPEQRAQRRATDRSILDMLTNQMADLRRSLGPADRQRLDQYSSNIREIEQRIARVEARNTSGEARELPGAPAGVPDAFDEHVKLMFDLQVLAFSSDTTRVFSFKLGRDGSGRVYPGSGVDRGFHDASHHGTAEERIRQFGEINKYHVSLLPYFLEKLQNTMDGEANLLDKTLVLYGSPMAVGNTHNHRNCPLILLGRGGGVRRARRSRQGAEGHADGERHADAVASARSRRLAVVWRQLRRVFVQRARDDGAPVRRGELRR